MKIDKEHKIIEFNNDDEFTNWALAPSYTTIVNDLGNRCFDVLYTDAYLNAVKEDYIFDIKDEDSLIVKRGCVSRGIITKPVENLL